jgi:type IV pilus assembly protein PilV
MKPIQHSHLIQLKRQAGFTLVEILVSIVIGAIGLMGVARLQLVTLQNNSASQYRSIAIQLASDLFERLRTNQESVNAGRYNQPATVATAASYNTPSIACASAGLCNSTERAATDLADAMTQARAVLPGGVIIVCIDSGSGSPATFNGTTIDPQCDGLGTTHAVKVFWQDDRSNKTTGLAAGGYTAFVTRGTP